MSLLEIDSLDIAFKKGKTEKKYTDKVSLHVEAGEIVCLVGESGCGKSITALSVLRLLGRNARIAGGSIYFDGRDLSALSERGMDKIRGNEIAMIFQNVMNSLNPCFTVGWQLRESIRRHLGYGRVQAESYALELLKKVGLPQAEQLMNKFPHSLSGGMRQRVMIAMALVCRPRLLIADEPTTALDVTIQLQIMQLLKSLRDEYGMGMLLITHDMGVVAEMADRVVVMYAGQCVEAAAVEPLFKRPLHPYTRALLDTVPDFAGEKLKPLLPIPGSVPQHYTELTGCRFAERCPYASPVCGQPQTYLEPELGRRVRCHLAGKWPALQRPGDVREHRPEQPVSGVLLHPESERKEQRI